MIVKDKDLLCLPCEEVKSRDEGGAIARKLFVELDKNNKKAVSKKGTAFGLGLSAPQIGLQKKVFVVKHKLCTAAFINPRIVAHSQTKVPFSEGCLSFPGKLVDTFRWPWVVVESLAGQKTFGPLTPVEWQQSSFLLISVVVQHEIAHLYGLLHFDFEDEDFPEFSEWATWSEKLRNKA